MKNAKTIRFYTRGKYRGFRKMSVDHILEAVSWIKSGNDVKIGGALINNPVSIIHIINANCEKKEKKLLDNSITL